MTGEDLAQKASLSQSKVSKIENGYSESFEPELLKTLLNILRAPKIIQQQIDLLLLQRTAAVNEQPTYTFGYDEDFAALAEHTQKIRTYIVCAISAALQTAEYREAYIRRLGFSEQQARVEMRKTMQYQDTLWDVTKSYHFIMPEAALYTLPANVKVQIAQLDRLERMSLVCHLHIGIIPLQTGMSVFETSSFSVYDDRLVYVHQGDRIVQFQDDETVLTYLQAFAEFDQKAVYDDEALQLIRKAADYFGGLS